MMGLGEAAVELGDLDIRADEIFSRALEMGEETRGPFVEQACRGESELRRLVDRLLAGALGDDALLRSGGAWGWATIPGEDWVGQGTVLDGRFRIVREIGQGGMGVVYLAERVDGQFDQQVALKVIHRGAGRRSAIRFLRERQILANLVHPKIARLLDGGVCPSGRPYLVMEYIEGRPIDRYCTEEGLGTKERVALLAEICEAVQVAHQHLVVHRDLKPSNILVTDSGEVRLLDFGIAKLIGGDASETPGLTQTGGPVMTPQYASPEQYRGDPITVASDVYQLGLVAYELLVGRRPFDLAEASPMEAVRRVCFETPTRPSMAAPSEGLRRGLAGDLDAILGQAMHKEPGRRYRSVDPLRDDLQRFLAGRPVSARPDRLGYRLGKFLARHRWQAVVAAIGLVVLLGLAGTFTWRLAAERDRTRHEARMAEEQRRNAEEVAGFLASLFEASNPLSQGSEPPTVREVLDRGAERIETELADQPATQARLMLTIGGIYHTLGRYQRARELLRTSLALRQGSAGGGAELAEHLDTLARVEMALGDPEAARGLLERALALRHAAGDEERVAATVYRLAACFQHQARWAEAEEPGRRAVDLARRLGRPAAEVARYLDGLANTLDELGRVDEARHLYREILAMGPEELGPWHPSRAVTLSNLADTHAREGEFETARPLLERALEIQQRVLGADHPHWAIMASNLGTCYRELGRFEEAETLYRGALALRRQVYGTTHLEVARSWVDLARLAWDRGDSVAAAEGLRRSLAIQEEAPTRDHPFLGETARLLDQVLGGIGGGIGSGEGAKGERGQARESSAGPQ